MRRVVALLDRRSVAWIALAIVSCLVALTALQPIWDPDVGWHLALGRTIVEQRSVDRPPAGGLYAATIAWANLHSAVVLLPVLLAIYASAEAVARRIGITRSGSDELGKGRLPRLALATGLGPDRVRRWLGAEANFESVAFPVGAVRFLDEVDLESRMFKPAGWGGYVLPHTYQKYPIFIDGRWVTVGERVTGDALRIERRLSGTFEKLDAYGVDLLFVPRRCMTDRIAEERGWIPVFENWNAGVYLRDDPANAENLGRCADYYAARGIPFDPARGFDGRAARRANREWAERFRAQRRHLRHFRMWGTPTGVSPEHLVDRW